MNRYEELAAINVNDHVEKKQNLSYLSWAWAVDQLLRRDPEATWAYSEPKAFGETLMVFCTVTAFGKAMTAQLPVMDHRNKAIQSPDAFQVNTAMQRALAKAIALHGLGLYIYAGEDLPAGADPAPDDTKAGKTAIEGSAKPVTLDVWDSLPAGQQQALQGMVDEVRAKLDAGFPDQAKTLLDGYDLSADEKVAMWSRFDRKERAAIKAAGKAANAA